MNFDFWGHCIVSEDFCGPIGARISFITSMAFYIKQRSIVFFKKDSRPTFSKYSCIRSGLTRRKVILFAKHLEKLIASLQFVAKGVKYHRTLYSDLCHVNKLGSG